MDTKDFIHASNLLKPIQEKAATENTINPLQIIRQFFPNTTLSECREIWEFYQSRL